jgi:hypothetical protein
MTSEFVATMKAARLKQLERLAGKLSATARELSSVEDRQNAYREIAWFRDRITALKKRLGGRPMNEPAERSP